VVSEQARALIDFEAAADCPYCQVELLTVGTQASDLVRCSSCGRRFTFGIGTDAVRISRLAVASLVAGISSLLLGILSGVPAVLFGLSALRRIRRSENRLRGRLLAISGIVSGSVLGLSCSAFFVLLVLFASAVHTTKDQAETMEMAAKLGTFDLPSEVKAISGDQVPMGLMVIRYADHRQMSKAGVLITRVHYPHWMGFTRNQAKSQVVYYQKSLRGVEIDDEEEFTRVIDGEEVIVTRQIRRGDGKQRFRTYLAILKGEHGVTLNMISIEDTPEEGDVGSPRNSHKIRWTDDEVRVFLQTYRRRPSAD